MARKHPLFRLSLPVVLGAAYYLAVRPQLLQAGTRPGEAEHPLPGDDVIAIPNFQATRAFEIAAPPDMVWPWIAQIGRDHTGFYGFDTSANSGTPSAAYLRRDLPDPEIGMEMDDGYRILDLEAGHFLLYGAFDLPTFGNNPMEKTALLLLEPSSSDHTRLIIRTRGYRYGMLAPVFNLALEIVDYLQDTAQGQNIKARAETLARLQTRKTA